MRILLQLEQRRIGLADPRAQGRVTLNVVTRARVMTLTRAKELRDLLFNVLGCIGPSNIKRLAYALQSNAPVIQQRFVAQENPTTSSSLSFAVEYMP